MEIDDADWREHFRPNFYRRFSAQKNLSGNVQSRAISMGAGNISYDSKYKLLTISSDSEEALDSIEDYLHNGDHIS